MLTIVAGKPGTGKTYHMMTILTDHLTDWIRYEIKHEKPFDSSVWTNISINIDGLNETISERLGKEVDALRYVNILDDSFFHDDECVYWWKKFPPKSLIVIDEVHHYLGKKIEYGSLDLEEQLINYLSMHRHGQQELYFLSQHTDNFANQVLGLADTLFEIVNVKNLHLPFPVSVPMADLDVLKKSFGIKTQYYQVNVGNYRGKAVKWSGATTRHLMKQDIYRVYKSHTKTDETSDRPELDLTPFEGVVWFSRKHAWHLVPKFAGVVSLPLIMMYVVTGLPSAVMEAASGKPKDRSYEMTAETIVPEPPKDVIRTDRPDTDERERVGEESLRLCEAVVSSMRQKLEETEQRLNESERIRIADSDIAALFPYGVLTRSGKRRYIGETLPVEGREEVLHVVDVRRGLVVFASGKIVTF